MIRRTASEPCKMWESLKPTKVKPGVRQPAVAGLFYPARREPLLRMLQSFLGQAQSGGHGFAKGIIAPHAGYPYSGAVAGSAFVDFKQPDRNLSSPLRVILIGPSHRVPFEGIALPEARAFSTPLGEVSLDREAVDRIRSLPGVQCLDTAHAAEHSLEVELPFLQYLLGEFTLVPLVLGEVDPERVSRVIETLWGGPETRFVISSDLSHYLSYKEAVQVDQSTAEQIEQFQDSRIGPEHACGCFAIRGFLPLARQNGLNVQTLDLRNSGDTAGTRDWVVGYGAFGFYESESRTNHGGSHQGAIG